MSGLQGHLPARITNEIKTQPLPSYNVQNNPPHSTNRCPLYGEKGGKYLLYFQLTTAQEEQLGLCDLGEKCSGDVV